MEIVKKGGMPDLKPLESTPPPLVKEIVLPPPAPIEAPVPPLPPVKPPPPIKLPPPPKPPEPPPIQVPTEPKPSPLKTYTNDFLQRIKETHASTATVLAAEQDAGTPKKVSEGPSRGSILSVTAGIALLLLGGLGAYIAYTHYVAKTQPVILTSSVSAPIFVDDKEKISGETPAAILKAISQSMGRQLAPNNIRLLYTDLATTTGNSIFSTLQLPAPDVLLRNVNAAQSMAGIVNVDGTPSLFFILSVASYPDTFAGMLSWEPTMLRDLGTLFPPYPPAVSTTTASVATTTPKSRVKTATSTSPAPLSPSSFRDEVVSNHDVRVYRDSEGRSILVYGYWNKTTLVIARDPSAFTEILNRLATSYTQ